MKASNKDESREKIRIPRMGPLVTRGNLIRILEQLEPHLGVELHIDGLQRAQTVSGGGLKLQLPASAPAAALDTWAIRDDLSIVPGLVGGKMPTLGGTALDAATPPTLTLGAGTIKVWFKLSFTTTFTSGYLTAATLDTVEVIESASTPTDTSGTTGTAVKHLQFNTAVDSVPTTSFFNTSIPVTLWDNGYEATTLRYGNL